MIYEYLEMIAWFSNIDKSFLSIYNDFIVFIIYFLIFIIGHNYKY